MIAEIEDALIALCDQCLGDTVDVASGPGSWDGDYLRNMVDDLPAVRVVWEGGAAKDETDMSLDATWTIYVVTGWMGGDQKSRRRGAGMAYAMIETLCAALHNLALHEMNDSTLDALTRVRVDTVENRWTAEWDRVGAAIYGIVLDLEVPIDITEERYKDALDDWLRAGVDFDLPDEGSDVDLEGDFDLPQTGD